MKQVLLYGVSGWIGSKMFDILQSTYEVIASNARLENYEEVEREIIQIKPTYVLLCAGLTGRPNIDWCEDHKIETLRVNTIGASVLGDLCYRYNIHMTYFGTGCIYEYNETHPMDGDGFTELDPPNFTRSFYSFSKKLTEDILKHYPNVLILRIRMPISDDLHSRSFVTKIVKYDKVVNIPNSMTILSDLLPVAKQMIDDDITGIYNFTNPGVVSHNEVLDLYKKYIDPWFNYENFSIEEQNKILKADRSNCRLDVSKLLEYTSVPDIKKSLEEVFKRMSSIQV